ncbi:hypothetical protein T440DRAFT_475877 [Plenodomus tracheiphilus IPT5]|uniref:Uncharacterized protein n=1 Tax=Plenodomus tracheiphilus IPT5 TaxID=1408161 RepID=A0A6A7BK41_9PLEO|nr:hypothetical protein T440DRAFT_475877 [Plenodomus tracheiphilus IPT5]
MPSHEEQDRVHLHGRRAGNVDHLKRIAHALNYTSFDPEKFPKGPSQAVRNVEVNRKPEKKQASFTLGVTCNDGSEEAVYDDMDEDIEPERLHIKKQSVSSLEELNRKGLQKSSLGAAIVNLRVFPPRLRSIPPIEDDSAQGISDSSTLNNPASVHASEELHESRSLAQEHWKQTQPKPEIKASPRCFQQTFVELFAGRRKPAKSAPMKKSCSNEPVFDESSYWVWSEEEGQAVLDRSSYIAAEPRLLLPEVIPDARPRGAALVLHHPDHCDFLPLRREHMLTGYAVVQADRFMPEKIHRGFNASGDPITPPMPTLAPFGYRAHMQGNSAAKLLDRDNKTWAGLNDKNPSPEKMPFAKKSSVEADLNEPQKPEDNSRTVGVQPAPCYLQHTGDNYPYTQGEVVA